MMDASEGRRVLIVEDEALVAMALETELRRAGYTVVGSVGRLDRAMLAVADKRFDVALLDVNLAGERVFPVADALDRRQIPFLFLTAAGPDIMPERFWRRPTFRKPYAAKPLLAALGRATGGAAPPPPADAGPAARPRRTPRDGLRPEPRPAATAAAAGRGAPAPQVAPPPPPPPSPVVAVQELPARTRPPLRRPNAQVRPREHLTAAEVERLVQGALERPGRHGARDAAMILLAYRHGLRASELVGLRWDQVDLGRGTLRIARLRNGRDSVHALGGREARALEELRCLGGGVGEVEVFATERRGPMTTAAFRKQLAAAARAAGLPFSVHPHMLRHSCGFELGRAGHDLRAIQAWLGHKDIRHTGRYAGPGANVPEGGRTGQGG